MVCYRLTRFEIKPFNYQANRWALWQILLILIWGRGCEEGENYFG